MTETHSIDQLERALRGDPGSGAGPDLAAARREGTRRRRLRSTGAGAGVVAAVVALSAGLALVQGAGVGTGRDDGQVADSPAPTPTSLSPLAERILAEVPGARRVSSWQVVIPAPDVPAQETGEERVPADRVAGEVVDLGARHYTGVTMYPRRAFPAWLHDEILRIERNAGDENGYPVGSTDMGVLVDSGSLRLACVEPNPEWGQDPGAPCTPAALSEDAGGLTYQWGMGTDAFLAPGSRMELFTAEDYSTGAPRTVWIGGRDGTDTARVELVTADGDRVDADVASGSLVPGETMFWASVPGELARATAYDADGEVLEEHRVRPCSGGVDCEVR